MMTGSSDRVIVVGKVIIDEYGKPGGGPAVLSIGGGGPQAAFGAAMALAILSNDASDPPAIQPVTFVGPVGEDWTDADAAALDNMLGAAIASIEVIKAPLLLTPRIQLWHDENECIQWRPLNNSFGPNGADNLWANRPSANDILALIGNDKSICCHVIVEGGTKGPGNGRDVQFLHNHDIINRLSFLGAEPVAFADAETGKISQGDADCIVSRLGGLSPTLRFISPDRDIYDAVPGSFWNNFDVGVRQGPLGSIVLHKGRQTSTVPAATLVTSDGAPVNPTGAGNSYAGAMTALRSRGVSLNESACIASAVGAVFCEYNHIPPWSSNVLARVRQAAEEIKSKLKVDSQL